MNEIGLFVGVHIHAICGEGEVRGSNRVSVFYAAWFAHVRF